LLHGLRRPLHVHQNHRHLLRGEYRCHRRIEAQRAHIVDHIRASVEGRARDRRLVRIDGNRRADRSAQAAHHRQHTRKLLFFGYRLSPRTGRFAADVENIRTARGHHHAIGDRLLGIVTPPAIEKRVRRHIDDSHDQSAAREIELAVASRQGAALSCHRC